MIKNIVTITLGVGFGFFLADLLKTVVNTVLLLAALYL